MCVVDMLVAPVDRDQGAIRLDGRHHADTLRRRNAMSKNPKGDVPKRILLATDLTPACDRAFDRAVQLASAWKADLTICHVVEASSARPWGMGRRIKNAETEIERLVRHSAVGQKLSRHIIVGDPAERTVEHARQIGIDFLITGPAHGKILGERLLGSTAARIVRYVNLPVLAVRRRAEGSYAAVAAGIDFSAASRTAFLYGRALFPAARFTLVHAYQISPDWGGPNADKSVDVIEAEEKARVLHAAEQELADLAATTGDTGSNLETNLQQGEPEAVLFDYVDKHWPDLVVAGTHGRTGAQQTAIGSVAEQLLNTLPCDILAVPTRK
jgi:nucleotide-binding universal stress UspA family protein